MGAFLTQNNWDQIKITERIKGRSEWKICCDSGVSWEAAASSARATTGIAASEHYPSEDIPCFLKPLITPAPTKIYLMSWLPGVFPADCTGHESWWALAIAPFICRLLQGAVAACWVPGSCCFLLLLLHGSYPSESFLISKGTHSQISAPPKIGARSYIFSPTKIIKLWGKKPLYIWQYLKYSVHWMGGKAGQSSQP